MYILKPWLLYSSLTLIFWGVWGAFIELPEKAGFPATMGFIVWALTMTLPCMYALKKINWQLEKKWINVKDGLIVGLAGAGGQLLLFKALETGPAFIVFPLISLYPILTIALAAIFLKERSSAKQWIGIIFALTAIFLYSYKDQTIPISQDRTWVNFAIGVFILWGIQALFFKTANQHSKAESIFLYMTVSGLLLSPIAYVMTDFSKNINYGFNGLYAAFLIQLLNSVGALLIVYAFRHGKAMIVAPLTGLAPMITVFISLLIYGIWPTSYYVIATVFSLASIYLISE